MLFRISLLLYLCVSTAIAQDVDVSVPFATIDVPPAYPGCELSDASDSKACTSKRIQRFFEEHFELKKIKALDLKPGRYRTSMIFKITKEGSVTNIKANNYQKVAEVEEEAIRVATMLPEFRPGEQRGEIVSVMYGLPIVFDIEPERRKKKG